MLSISTLATTISLGLTTLAQAQVDPQLVGTWTTKSRSVVTGPVCCLSFPFSCGCYSFPLDISLPLPLSLSLSLWCCWWVIQNENTDNHDARTSTTPSTISYSSPNYQAYRTRLRRMDTLKRLSIEQWRIVSAPARCRWWLEKQY